MNCNVCVQMMQSNDSEAMASAEVKSGDDRGAPARPYVQHIALIDLGAAVPCGVAVVPDFEHAPADVRLMVLEEPLDEHNVDTALSITPIEAEHPADRRRAAQAPELHPADWRPDR